MRINKPRTPSKMDVKMTPMIDVVFQLLIFFVCTVSFQALEEILPADLQAPEGQGTTKPLDPALEELEEVVIRVVSEEGRTAWVLNERTYADLASLRGTLGQLVRIRSDLPVILDIDATVPMGDVIDVYDACRVAGFDRVQFAAKAKG
jgi:biopolymer transport protein ExbD